MKIITQKPIKNLPFLLLLFNFLLLCSCQNKADQNPHKYGHLQSAQGDLIEVSLVVTQEEQQKGLSGIKPEDFSDNQGMLFYNLEEREHNFWMPDTYFDLDLFYLDANLKVIAIDRKIPHYIGKQDPERIPRGRIIWCRHILEMKSASLIAQKIKEGDQLLWKFQLSQQQIESQIRPWK